MLAARSSLIGKPVRMQNVNEYVTQEYMNILRGFTSEDRLYSRDLRHA